MTFPRGLVRTPEYVSKLIQTGQSSSYSEHPGGLSVAIVGDDVYLGNVNTDRNLTVNVYDGDGQTIRLITIPPGAVAHGFTRADLPNIKVYVE